MKVKHLANEINSDIKKYTNLEDSDVVVSFVDRYGYSSTYIQLCDAVGVSNPFAGPTNLCLTIDADKMTPEQIDDILDELTKLKRDNSKKVECPICGRTVKLNKNCECGYFEYTIIRGDDEEMYAANIGYAGTKYTIFEDDDGKLLLDTLSIVWCGEETGSLYVNPLLKEFSKILIETIKKERTSVNSYISNYNSTDSNQNVFNTSKTNSYL